MLQSCNNYALASTWAHISNFIKIKHIGYWTETPKYRRREGAKQAKGGRGKDKENKQEINIDLPQYFFPPFYSSAFDIALIYLPNISSYLTYINQLLI